jgi:hypothetical protein
MSDDPEWFAPKRFGYGAGRPIRWQGWALLIAYIVLVGLASLLLRYSLVGTVSVLVMLTATFMVISARTTRGGWRWRWGEKD